MKKPEKFPLSSGLVNGFRAAGGFFEEDESGDPWMIFEEPDDLVFWCPINGLIATWEGRAFALGQARIDNPATYALDGRLRIHSTVGRWILAEGQGIFVFDWKQAFERLRFAPRIRVDAEIAYQYQQHMVPANMPDVVVRSDKRAARHAA